jgi:hypothetical protein
MRRGCGEVEGLLEDALDTRGDLAFNHSAAGPRAVPRSPGRR